MSTTGGVSRERGYTALIVLLLIAIGFAALDFFLLNQKNGEDRQAIALTTQIQVLSQQTAKFALEVGRRQPRLLQGARIDPQRDRLRRAAVGQGRPQERHAALRGQQRHACRPCRECAGRVLEAARRRHRQDPFQQGGGARLRAAREHSCAADAPAQLEHGAGGQHPAAAQRQCGTDAGHIAPDAVRRPHHPPGAGSAAGRRQCPVGGRRPVPRCAVVRQRAERPDRGQPRQRRATDQRRQRTQDSHRHGGRLGRTG